MVHRAVLLANLLAVASASPLYRRDTVTTLKVGDSVDKIAASASVQLADVSNANPGVNLATVTPGQVITIPSVPAAPTGATTVAAPIATSTASSVAVPSSSGAAATSVPAVTSASGAAPTSGAAASVTEVASAIVTAPGVSVSTLAPDEGKANDALPDASTFFQGNGLDEPGDGKVKFPTRDQWISFDELFKRNVEIMGTNCVGEVTPNTPEDNENIKAAILEVAPISGVDPRFILASIMQESNGCVRVKGTPSGEPGVFNPGLMQTFKGNGTCNVDNTQELNPCPPEQIKQMVIDGVQGTLQEGTAQAGLVQRLNEAAGDGSGQAYYEASRLYNSGSIANKDALEEAGKCGPPRSFGVPCYSSDIANRLLGWVKAPNACTVEPETNCPEAAAAPAAA